MALDWALKPKRAPMTLEIPREYYASDEAWIEAKRMIEAANRP